MTELKQDDSLTHLGSSKVDRYKWLCHGKPGQFMLVDKRELNVDHEAYQRALNQYKVVEYASDWNWVSAGVMIITKRDGRYYVIDGQHRVMAAMKRSDITLLPCMFFESLTITEEAQAFLDVNRGRKPVTAIDTHRAAVTAGDEASMYFENACRERGLTICKHPSSTGQIMAVSWAVNMIRKNRQTFDAVFPIACDISAKDNVYVKERLLSGLAYIHEHVEGGMSDRRLVERIYQKGANKLHEAAVKAAAYFTRGGARVHATGMLEALNSGLRTRFCFIGQED